MARHRGSARFAEVGRRFQILHNVVQALYTPWKTARSLITKSILWLWFAGLFISGTMFAKEYFSWLVVYVPRVPDNQVLILCMGLPVGVGLHLAAIFITVHRIYQRRIEEKKPSLENLYVQRWPPVKQQVDKEAAGEEALLDSGVTDVAFDASADCPICCSCCAGSLNLVKTGCGHVFHEACLERWVHIRCTCPVCRHDLRREAP
eukprot:gnl/MRDRNA2_/MRDRNA2_151803_c0_seq1.p1 gnl/MRDRNA2_/MRDRNA2_151803_c0~~gnl/MRDRNA2_/MRDRNA2_151803_c0_seq1.p1  ORF type:complete len:229 (+),score=28.73 gnl/MRDRNA2_/MRDRNA2_151803_c0_seq1:74-688(+)